MPDISASVGDLCLTELCTGVRLSSYVWMAYTGRLAIMEAYKNRRLITFVDLGKLEFDLERSHKSRLNYNYKWDLVP